MFCHLTLLLWYYYIKLFYLSVWFVALKEEFLSYPCSGLLLFPKLVPNSDDQFPLVPGNVKTQKILTWPLHRTLSGQFYMSRKSPVWQCWSRGGGGIRAPVSLIYGNIAEGVGSLVGPEYLLIALWVSDTHICTHRRSIVCVRVR